MAYDNGRCINHECSRALSAEESKRAAELDLLVAYADFEERCPAIIRPEEDN